MTAAEKLRRAAEVLRERAEAFARIDTGSGPLADWLDARAALKAVGFSDPTVALAVADWLEADATLLQPDMSIEDDQTLRYAGRLADAILAGVEA